MFSVQLFPSAFFVVVAVVAVVGVGAVFSNVVGKAFARGRRNGAERNVQIANAPGAVNIGNNNVFHTNRRHLKRRGFL